MSVIVTFEKVDPGATIPQKGSIQAAGFDLRAIEQKIIYPKCTATVRTGLKIQLPPGYEAQVRPRSGLAAMAGVTVLNSPGTIDADYRGEVRVLIINHGSYTYNVEPGHRIAQLVIQRLPEVIIEEGVISDLTARGAGGFGSTGK